MARTTSPAGRKKPSSGYIKERVKGATVTPDYMLRLLQHVGPTIAAELIGTTTGTLHRARAGNTVTPSIEVAARGVWLERGFVEGEDAEEIRRKAGAETRPRASPLSRPYPLPPALPQPAAPRSTDMHQVVASPHNEGTKLYLIQVAKDRAAILERTAEALGATIISQA